MEGMPYPKPIPEDWISYPIRDDFPIEAGFTENLRSLIRQMAKGEPSRTLRPCLPPNLDPEDYLRISNWADFPERVAYYETNGIDGARPHPRPVVAMVTPEVKILLPQPQIWTDLMDKLIEFRGLQLEPGEYPPWGSPMGGQPSVPALCILHDRPSRRGYLVETKSVDQYLVQNLRWTVPT
jgi:hypothetical protein